MNYCTNAPDKPFGIDISMICLEHDIDYSLGGNKLDRKKADIRFRSKLKNKNIFIAWIYYIAVRLFGGKHFNWKNV